MVTPVTQPAEYQVSWNNGGGRVWVRQGEVRIDGCEKKLNVPTDKIAELGRDCKVGAYLRPPAGLWDKFTIPASIAAPSTPIICYYLCLEDESCEGKNEQTDATEFKARLVWSESTARHATRNQAIIKEMPLGIYISVPFCKTKCSYCNFASGVFSKAVFARYVDRVCEDIERFEQSVGQMGGMIEREANSIYLGGGTPTLLEPSQLQRLFAAVRHQFVVSHDAEITVECAPGTLSPK